MPLRYDPTAALKIFPEANSANLADRLNAARSEVLADVDLWQSNGTVPTEKDPLDAGFIPLPEDLLSAYEKDPDKSPLGQILATAAHLKYNIDRLLVLGIVGSYMGARALFEALCDPYHNELPREKRQAPRLYFEGNNVDNDAISSLISLLESGSRDNPADRWGIVVIS